MSDEASFLVEDFIHSIATQLDRVQDALRLKAVNRPLTYALKDFSLDLHVFAEMDAEGHVRFRTAGANESGASTVRIAFTTITRPMIEENTVSLQAASGPSLDELGLDPGERRRLEQLGVRNAGQLNRLQRSAGSGTISRLAHLPAARLREALQRGRPVLGNVSIVRPGPATPPPASVVKPAPAPAIVLPPKASLPTPLPKPDAGAPPMVRPVFEPKAPATRVRLEGRNLLGGGVPKARFNEVPLTLASADDDSIELDVPDTVGVLTLELPDGETHTIPFEAAPDADGGWAAARVDDPWGQA